MPKDRSYVRASDIGMWAFCNRAWWLANVKKAPHQDPQRLMRGEAVHQQHGRQLVLSRQLYTVGLLLLAVALILLGILILWQMF
ncbi:MAG: hypothetical protein R3A44_08160 [Caldilineaceae bacterium]